MLFIENCEVYFFRLQEYFVYINRMFKSKIFAIVQDDK